MRRAAHRYGATRGCRWPTLTVVTRVSRASRRPVFATLSAEFSRGGPPATGPPAPSHPPEGAVPSCGPTLSGQPSRKHHRRSATGGPCPVPLRQGGLGQPLPFGPKPNTMTRPWPRMPPPWSWPAYGGSPLVWPFHACDQPLQGVEA